MGYTTTTFTRRIYKLKVKPKQRAIEQAPRRIDGDANGAKRVPLPPLFERSSVRRVAAVLPSPLRHWKWIAPILIAVLGSAIYYFPNKGPAAYRQPADQRQARAGVEPLIPPGIHMRAMRLSSGSRSARGNGSPASMSGAGSGGETTGSAADRHERDPAVYALANDGVLFDGGRKVVLPSDVTGACSVGAGALKDLGACMLQNGARAE